MPYVQKFERKMIEQTLRSNNLRFLRDSDDDFVLEWGYDDEHGCALKSLLMVGGGNKDVYRITTTSDRRIPRNDWGRTIMICNTWNMERNWPKAYLRVANASDNYGLIVLENAFDLEKGIHQELLDDFTLTAIGTAFQFWKWAHQEQGL